MPILFGIPAWLWLVIGILCALSVIAIIGIATAKPKGQTKADWLRKVKKLKPDQPIQCFQCNAWLLAKNATRHLLTRCSGTPTDEKDYGEPLNLTPGKTYRLSL